MFSVSMIGLFSSEYINWEYIDSEYINWEYISWEYISWEYIFFCAMGNWDTDFYNASHTQSYFCRQPGILNC